MTHGYHSVQEGTGEEEQMVSFKERPCHFPLCPQRPYNVAAEMGLSTEPRTHRGQAINEQTRWACSSLMSSDALTKT